jgi:CRISPR-associated endonuclease/helicase Cas3
MRDKLSQYWGKAQPNEEASNRWHPLLAHCLDVAAVAQSLVVQQPQWIDPTTIAALVALHDVGKLTAAFQAKVPDCWPVDALGPYRGPISDPGHDSLGFHLLRDPRVSAQLGPLLPDWLSGHRRCVLAAVTGHHGCPPQKGRFPDTLLGRAAYQAAAALIDLVLECLSPAPLPAPTSDRQLQILCWRLAGIAVLADWVGSSQRHFPYRSPSELGDPRRYFQEIAIPQAKAALAASGLSLAPTSRFEGMERLFPGRRAEPNTIQAWAESVALPKGPTLVVIEDMTGSGKTEAAVTLAHRIMAERGANGLFLALPTMATANAMYGRLAEAYRSLFAAEARPSLALAHGRASLDDRFARTIIDFGESDLGQPSDAADEPASAQCAAWIADDRRRALLAQIGVGTVDQAFLAILPVRHAALRQYGLANKVLIVDEAHAFDPYMRREMAALLRFHAAMGGSAILLSATLTQKLRQQLAEAFLDGVGAESKRLTEHAYPLATLVSNDGISEQALKPREGLARSLPVERLNNADDAVARILAASQAGAAVAWVRNTVDDAIQATDRLRAVGLEPLLFHARFALTDRLKIEAEVIRRFGARSSAEDRRKVLVATQVVEQSLDIDFDLMISDLAPVDLLIQRAGRLWRHRERPHRPLPTPAFLVLGPEPVETPDADWLAGHPGSMAVYRDPALLWRGARALFSAGAIHAPDGLRELIEAAADGDVPPAFSEAAGKSFAKQNASGAIADQNVIDFQRGYCRDAGAWENDVRTPTRLEEHPQITLRLARWRNGVVEPYAEHPDLSRAWALSEVQVAEHRIRETALPGEVQGPAAAARQRWGKWERESERIKLAIVTPLEEGGFELLGVSGINGSSLAYAASLGVVMSFQR